jgi:hypothetical protein
MPILSFLRWLTPARSPSPLHLQEQNLSNYQCDAENDAAWRNLSDDPFAKDVQNTTCQETLRACYEAYSTNPIAFAIIEITTSFVLGKGVTISASDPAVQRVLLNFWRDPDNRLDMRIYSICTELSLYGEQFIRFYVNPLNGSVKIRQLDPSIIDQIESDPDDIETVLRFHRCAYHNASPSSLDGEWLIAGQDVMQFCINKVSNARRGRSDLATLLPWLVRYKDWLTDRVRLNHQRAAFLWDVELQGADRITIDRKQREHALPPEPGSIIIHNESEHWTAVKPEINANDAAEDGRALKLMLAIGAQIPEHYLADGSCNNRATAVEMGLPTFLKFQRRQRTLLAILRTIFDRVLLEAQKAQVLPSTIDTSYEILFPDIDITDHQTLASATQTIVSALTSAKEHGWVSDETAMRLLFQFAGEEMDIHEELARIHQQQAPQHSPQTASRASQTL